MSKTGSPAKKALIMLLAFIMTVGTIVPVAFMGAEQDAYAATTVNYKKTTKNDFAYFAVTSGSVTGASGYCIDAMHAAPSKTGKATIEKLPQNHALTRVIYYYCVKKGWKNSKTASSGYGWWNHDEALHYILAYTRVKCGYKVRKYNGQKITTDLMRYMVINHQNCTSATYDKVEKAYTTAMKAVASAPDSFEVYYMNPSDQNDMQDALVYREVPPGSASLKKSSSNATATTLPGYNSFAGITYGLYASNKSTRVGTFNVTAGGTSNTITGLAPGLYYAIEEGTNPYYAKSNDWIGPVEVKSNQNAVFYAVDPPTTGSAEVIKVEEDGYDMLVGDEFLFHCVNVNNANIAFDVPVKVLSEGPSASATKSGILAGTYRVTETSMPLGYADSTGTGTLVVPPNGTGSITWSNKSPYRRSLHVLKQTDDGSSVKGFKFKVTGELYNQGTLTKNMLLTATEPTSELIDTESYNTPGEWTVNEEDLAAVNNAAKERGNGVRTVRLTNKATHKAVSGKTAAEIVAAIEPVPTEAGNGTITNGTIVKKDDKFYKASADVQYEYAFTENPETGTTEFDASKTAENIEALLTGDSFTEVDTSDLDMEIKVKINLKPVTYDAENDEYKATVTNKNAEPITVEGKYKTNHKNFDWNGAATLYIDRNTGNEYSMLATTDETGKGYLPGETREGINKGITYGKFTIEEVMTDAQARRYMQPEPIVVTREYTEGEDFLAISETFTNEARRVPVNLAKTSPDGNVGNIDFTLTGTSDFGDEVNMSGKTDNDGHITFGNPIYAGTYVVEETGFDKSKYVNNHPAVGYKNPVIQFTLTVANDGSWAAAINGGETITGTKGEALTIPFDNEPKTVLQLTKVDGETYQFLENAEFELYEDGVRVYRFQIVKNDDGTAGIHRIWPIDPDDSHIKGYEDKHYIDEETPEQTEDIIVDDQGGQGGQSGDSGDSGDSDTPGEGGAVDPGNIDMDSLNWTKLEGLRFNKNYKLVEISAPKGYVAAAPEIDFVYETNPTRICIYNFVPEIETLALDSETGTHTACADKSVKIVDTVSYTHLSPNTEYTLKGSLMKKTHLDPDDETTIYVTEPVKDNGKEVTAEKTFTTNADGTATVETHSEDMQKLEFSFDGSNLEGAETVVFEKLYKDGKLVTEHTDSTDKAQTVSFPEIKTNAKDPNSRTGLGCISETQTIVDTVTYKHLDPNVQYKMKATLFDKKTGELIKDKTTGDPYTVEKTFTPEKASGTIDVVFTVNSKDLISHQAVAYEECYIAGETDILVGFHKDKDDAAQTIIYPDPVYEMRKVRVTDAFKKEGSDKYGFRIGDTVEYKVYVENKGNCPLTLDVRDSFTGEAEKYFSLPVITNVENATQNSISEDKNKTNITVDTGKTAIVTYSATVLPEAKEYLAPAKADSKTDDKDGWTNTAYVENPTFPDPENPDNPVPSPQGGSSDTAQTPVVRPVITTEIGTPKKGKVVDDVYYENIKPNEEYVMRGVLMNKKEEEEVEGSDGEATFTPSKSKGKVSVELNLKSAKYDVVAFEYCYIVTKDKDGAETEVLVAEHTDIDDKAQTLEYNPGPKTGEFPSALIYVGALVLIGGAAFALKKKGSPKK